MRSRRLRPLAAAILFVLTLLLGFAGVPGCSTGAGGPDREQLCTASQNSYAAYLAMVNAGIVPDDSAIAAAAKAAADLLLRCGWTQPTNVVRGPGATASDPVLDTFGVPIALAPRR